MGDPGWSLTRLCLSFGKCKQRIRSFPLSPHSCSPPQVAQMTSSPATTPPCLGHLRLGLPLSSSPRKVAILDVLVGVASIWVAAGAGLGVCIGLNTSKCVCVCVCVWVFTCMCRNVSEYVMCEGVWVAWVITGGTCPRACERKHVRVSICLGPLEYPIVPGGVVGCWRAYPAGILVPGPLSDGLSSWIICLSQCQVWTLGSRYWLLGMEEAPPGLPSCSARAADSLSQHSVSLSRSFCHALSPPVYIPPFAPQGSRRPQTRPTSSLRALRPL